MPASIKRTLIVTAALSAIGAVCGVVLGSLAFWVELWRLPGTSAPEELPKLAILGATGGALFGAVLAPIVAWIFLRRVTIGRAIAETSIGVLAGIAVGGLLQPQLTIVYALGGFVAAGARLWAVAPATASDRTSSAPRPLDRQEVPASEVRPRPPSSSRRASH